MDYLRRISRIYSQELADVIQELDELDSIDESATNQNEESSGTDRAHVHPIAVFRLTEVAQYRVYESDINHKANEQQAIMTLQNDTDWRNRTQCAVVVPRSERDKAAFYRGDANHLLHVVIMIQLEEKWIWGFVAMVEENWQRVDAMLFTNATEPTKLVLGLNNYVCDNMVKIA